VPSNRNELVDPLSLRPGRPTVARGLFVFDLSTMESPSNLFPPGEDTP
jgi:hypothetical protein